MASAFPQRSIDLPRGTKDHPIAFLVGALILFALLVLPFVFLRAYSVPTGSMENTLLIGDHIFVRVLPRVNVGREDIIVFHTQINRDVITTVKRVVGVAGDHLRIAKKVLYRNGVAVREPYAVHTMDGMMEVRDNFPSSGELPRQNLVQSDAAVDMMQHHLENGEAVVPVGKYFVLGDNRDNSLDSRFLGFVDKSDVVGKPVLIYYSIDPARSSFRGERIFKKL